MEGAMQGFQAALESIDRRLLALGDDLRSLRAEHRADARWLIGLLVALFLAVIDGFGTVLNMLSRVAK